MHLAWGWLIRLESVHRLPGLAEDVWVGDRAAPDVDGVAADLVEPPHRVLGFEDVAAARNRDRDMAFDLAHQIPIGPALVALDARAPVERDHRAAAILNQLRDLDAVDRFVVPARADLHRHRDGDRAFDLGQDFFELRQVAQQIRSAAAVDHLLRRTPAVYVDKIGAGLLGDLGGPAHPHLVVSENLDRYRALFRFEAHHLMRAHVAARQTFDADEFGDDQTQPAAFFGDPAKRRIGHARHRREDERRREFAPFDLE